MPLYLDSGQLDPNENPIYSAETTPTSGVSAGTTTNQPPVGSIIADTPQNLCNQKWETYSANMTFPSQEAYKIAYDAYIKNCLNIGVKVGVSVIGEPDLGGIRPPESTIPALANPTTGTQDNTSPNNTTGTTSTTGATGVSNILPNLGAFLGSITGGGAGGGSGAGATEEVALSVKKKPFPYWILIVGAVGAYLIFKKEK